MKNNLTSSPALQAPDQNAEVGVFPPWVLKATYFLSTGSGACISRFIVVYYSHIDFNPVQIGCLTVGSRLTRFIGSLFWGYLADRSKNLRLLFAISFVAGIGTVITIPLLDAFWYQLTLTLTGNFIRSITSGVLDAVAIVSAKKTGSTYGRQRMWCALSWGICSLAAGTLIDKFGLSVMFIGYSVMEVLNVILLLCFVPNNIQMEEDQPDQEETKSKANSMCSCEVLFFLLNLFIYGNCTSFVETYLLLFLDVDFGASKTLMGLCILVMTLAECVVFLSDESILQRLTIPGSLLLSMLIYSARCWAYTYLLDNHVWYILFLEPTHGVTFALMWTASVKEAARLAPANKKGMMMSYVTGIYYYGAQASGSLIGGFLFHHYGADFMYRVGGTTAGIWSVFYFITSVCCMNFRIPRSGNQDTGYASLSESS